MALSDPIQRPPLSNREDGVISRIRCSCHPNCREVLAHVVDGAIVIRRERHGEDHAVRINVANGGLLAW